MTDKTQTKEQIVIKRLPKELLFSDRDETETLRDKFGKNPVEVGTDKAIEAAKDIYSYMAATGKDGDIFRDAEGREAIYHGRGCVRGDNMLENIWLAETKDEIIKLLNFWVHFTIKPQPDARDNSDEVLRAAKIKLLELYKVDKTIPETAGAESIQGLLERLVREPTKPAEPQETTFTDKNNKLSMAKMVRIYIDQNPTITFPECKKKVNAALKLQGRTVSPDSIRNQFYPYKKLLKTKNI